MDVEIKRMCRDTLAERFPGHGMLAEELPNPAAGAAAPEHRWIFDPIDGTVNYAHGLPIFCASLALEVAGRVETGRSTTRHGRSCSSPSGAAARS